MAIWSEKYLNVGKGAKAIKYKRRRNIIGVYLVGSIGVGIYGLYFRS